VLRQNRPDLVPPSGVPPQGPQQRPIEATPAWRLDVGRSRDPARGRMGHVGGDQEVARRRGGMRRNRFGSGWAAPWVRLLADRDEIVLRPPFPGRRVVIRREQVTGVYLGRDFWTYMIKFDGQTGLDPYFAFYSFDPGGLLIDLAAIGWPCDMKPRD
jgi:hypothetical protein